MAQRFYHVDAFTDLPLAGNPAVGSGPRRSHRRFATSSGTLSAQIDAN